MGGNPTEAIGLLDQNMQKIDEFRVKLSGGVQTLGNKYLVLIDDSSETKNENTKFIMYDMETHKEVGEALKVDFIE